MLNTAIRPLVRLAAVVALTAALLIAYLALPGIALAHHVELTPTTTCDSYTITADYIGGAQDRTAKVYVNGALAGTYSFPGSGPDFVDDFYVLSGSLPANVTVEIRWYFPGGGLDGTASSTVNEDMTCTPTATATSTATTPPTDTPTPVDTDTPTPRPTDTPVPSSTVTPASSATPAPSETSTPVNTNTPTAVASATSTPRPPTATSTAAAETPTFVSTVEALLPPEGPSTTGSPPSETASGLPNTGAGHAGAGIALAVALLALTGAGLAVVAAGMRRRLA
jgi:hypothetical protein